MYATTIAQLPTGTPVILPTGRTGVVIKPMNNDSDQFDRVCVKYDDDGTEVTIQPKLLIVQKVAEAA